MIDDTLISSLLAAGNIVVVLVSAYVALYFSRLLGGDALDGFARNIAVGVVYFASGMALWRWYWAFQRILESRGIDSAAAVYSSFSWLTLGMMAIVLYGYAYLLSREIGEAFGIPWMARYFSSVVGIWLAVTFILEASK